MQRQSAAFWRRHAASLHNLEINFHLTLKLSIAIKSIFASFLCRIRWVNWNLGRLSRSSYVILAYHRVLPHDEAMAGVQAGMYVTPETFKSHLKYLREYFDIITLKNLAAACEDAFDRPPTKPVCVLTFDDGWLDFYKYAFPILKTVNVPATVLLPTDFIGTKDWFWTDRLGYLFLKRENRESLSKFDHPSTIHLVNQLEELKGSRESRLEKAIAMLKGYRNDEIREVLSELAVRWQLDPKPPGRAFLSWKEVREMTQSGLITFGSHTVGHKILTTLTEDEINTELVESRKRLIDEQAVDPSFIPFCYPNGNYNKKIAVMVKNAGYDLAVTTKKGWNNSESDPFTLRRIGIHQDMTSTDAMFGCRITGIF